MQSYLYKRGKRLFQGSMLRTVRTVLEITIAFFIFPFLVHQLGDSQYGLWVLIMTIADYYVLLRLGFSESVARYLTRAIGKEDIKEKSQILSTSFYIYLSISFVMLLATAAIIIISKMFIEDPNQLILFRKIILVLGINTSISPPLSVYGALLHSHLLFKISESVNILIILLKNILIYIFISMGYGLISIALIFLFCNIFKSLIFYTYRHKYFSEIKINFRYLAKDKFKILFKYSFFTFIAQIAHNLKYKVDSVIVASFITLTAVTHYSIALRMITYFSILIGGAIGLLTPYFSQEEGRGDFKSIKEKFVLSTKISIFISTYIGVSLILYGKPFVQRWMGLEYIDSIPVLIILTIPTLFMLAQLPTKIVLYSISKNKFFAYGYLIEGIMNLVLSLILVTRYGLIGVAMGTAIPTLLFQLIIQPFYIKKILNLNLIKYYIKILAKNIALASISILLFYYVIKKFISPSYLILVTLGLFQTCYFIIIIYSIGFSKYEKKQIKDLIF